MTTHFNKIKEEASKTSGDKFRAWLTVYIVSSINARKELNINPYASLKEVKEGVDGIIKRLSGEQDEKN